MKYLFLWLFSWALSLEFLHFSLLIMIENDIIGCINFTGIYLFPNLNFFSCYHHWCKVDNNCQNVTYTSRYFSEMVQEYPSASSYVFGDIFDVIIFKVLFIYLCWKARCTERRSDGNIFHSLVCSPSDHNCWSQAHLKLGAWIFLLVSHEGSYCCVFIYKE